LLALLFQKPLRTFWIMLYDPAIMPVIAQHRRIVVKVGSALLVDKVQGLKSAWLNALVSDLSAEHARCILRCYCAWPQCPEAAAWPGLEA
jgi:hypothetical protein